MRAVVTQKVASIKTAYGEKVGGKVGDGSPGNIETSCFDNVTSVVETTAGGIPVYQITHMTGDDTEPHTTTYGVADYIISVIGG